MTAIPSTFGLQIVGRLSSSLSVFLSVETVPKSDTPRTSGFSKPAKNRQFWGYWDASLHSSIWQARLADYKAQVAAAEARHWIDVIVLKRSICCIYLSILVTFKNRLCPICVYIDCISTYTKVCLNNIYIYLRTCILKLWYTKYSPYPIVWM